MSRLGFHGWVDRVPSERSILGAELVGFMRCAEFDCRTPAEIAAAYDSENYVPFTTNIHGKT